MLFSDLLYRSMLPRKLSAQYNGLQSVLLIRACHVFVVAASSVDELIVLHAQLWSGGVCVVMHCMYVCIHTESMIPSVSVYSKSSIQWP